MERQKTLNEEVAEQIQKGPLAELGKEILAIFGQMTASKRQLDENTKNLEAAVEKYKKARQKLFEDRAKESGLKWCALHQGFVSSGDLRLLFVRGVESEGLCDFRDDSEFQRLYRVCQDCFHRYRENVSNKLNRDFERWQVREAEDLSGTICIRWNEKWLPLPAGTEIVPEFPEIARDAKLAQEWNIPPSLSFQNFIFGVPSLTAFYREISVYF
ncbi:MAG TPA: hypothetical protein VJB92_01845 [Candidatus Paceibacterota bacterium]